MFLEKNKTLKNVWKKAAVKPDKEIKERQRIINRHHTKVRAQEIRPKRSHKIRKVRAETRRRQELPAVYQPNGAVYVARVDWYRRNLTFVGRDTVPYVMPPERSLEVDSALDMALISAIFTGNSANFSGKPG